MRLFFLVCFSLAPAVTAYADDRTIDDACLRVAEIEIGQDGLTILGAQSFPELNPPRTEIEVGGVTGLSRISDFVTAEIGAPVTGGASAGVIKCEFENAAPPMTLTSYSCTIYPGCKLYFDPAAKRSRTDELRVLLEREGF